MMTWKSRYWKGNYHAQLFAYINTKLLHQQQPAAAWRGCEISLNMTH
jgi:hypothetical protein